eukprot:6966437-Prymnesium_polylepis.1
MRQGLSVNRSLRAGSGVGDVSLRDGSHLPNTCPAPAVRPARADRGASRPAGARAGENRHRPP